MKCDKGFVLMGTCVGLGTLAVVGLLLGIVFTVGLMVNTVTHVFSVLFKLL